MWDQCQEASPRFARATPPTARRATPHAVAAPIHNEPHTHTRDHAIAATAQKKKTAGDCEPYYFDWLKCIDKCAMPHIMQKLK